jgi:cation transport ATPase
VLLLLPQVLVGAPFYKQAWHGLKYGSANMGLLVALSTTAAFGGVAGARWRSNSQASLAWPQVMAQLTWATRHPV